MKQPFFNVHSFISQIEPYFLFRLMAIGESPIKEFLDKRNQILFDTLTHLQKQNGLTGTHELCRYLASQNQLEAAGGLVYIQKVFASFEPEESYQ
jgi:hypothetical protein